MEKYFPNSGKIDVFNRENQNICTAKNILLHLESSYLVIETNVPIRGNVYKCLKNYLS